MTAIAVMIRFSTLCGKPVMTWDGRMIRPWTMALTTAASLVVATGSRPTSVL